MQEDDRRGDPVLKWLAVAVPGMSAGTGWAATAGWPPLNRVLAGIATGVAIYALIHFAIKLMNRNRK
jgi:hypothetical protein